MAKTRIEWCDMVWNPITGCQVVSEGCVNCYAKRIAGRFWGERDFGEVQIHEDRLTEPFDWKKPRRVFVDSMGDVWHPDVKKSWLEAIYQVMSLAKRHTFLILTKRPWLALNWYRGEGAKFKGLENVWVGTSIENQKRADERLPALMQLDGVNLFLSLEPLLGPVNLRMVVYEDGWCVDPLRGMHWMPGFVDFQYGCNRVQWVIVGGENGPGARPCHPDWVRGVREQCLVNETPFFFKGWGEWAPGSQMTMRNVRMPGAESVHLWDDEMSFAVGKAASGALLDGEVYEEFPGI